MSAFLTGFSSVLSAVGQLQQGASEAETAKYNARVAQLQATQVRRASEFEQEKLRRQKSKTLASQRARYLASGISLEGSPLEVMIDTASQFELDLATERYNRDVLLSQLKFEKQYQKRLGKTALTSSYLAAGGTILKGVTGIASEWSRLHPPKTPYKPKNVIQASDWGSY